MEELFQNKTKYTEKEYKLFLESYKEEYALSDILYIIFYIAFFIFFFIVGIVSKEYLVSVAMFICLIIYIWFKFFRTKKKIEKEKESPKIKEAYITTFKFYKRFFRVQNKDGKAQVWYLKMYKVVETDTHFYIYISRDYAFIISKKGFINSTSREFGEFIKKKAWGKYKKQITDNKNTQKK